MKHSNILAKINAIMQNMSVRKAMYTKLWPMGIKIPDCNPRYLSRGEAVLIPTHLFIIAQLGPGLILSRSRHKIAFGARLVLLHLYLLD